MGVVPVTMPAEIRRRRKELVLRVQRVDDAVDVFAAASAHLITRDAGTAEIARELSLADADHYEPLHQKEALHISQGANYT
jgi:hypothetical protein